GARGSPASTAPPLALPSPAAFRWGHPAFPSRPGHRRPVTLAAWRPWASERDGPSLKEAIMSTSRRDFLATSLAALVSAAFARPGLARVLLRPGQEPAFTPVRRSVGYFTMRGGTIGYLVNGDGVVVVDTQFPEPARAFLEGLNTR